MYEIVQLEKRIFLKHKSLARSFHDELKRRNSGLIYSTSSTGDGGEVIGYAMYTCATSLCASITKLAMMECCRRQGHGEALLKATVERCRRRRVQRRLLCTGRSGSRSRSTTLHGGMLTEWTWIFRNHQELSKKILFIA